jgi:sulfoxide reductase heme-binding subunit YedZ
MLLLGLSYYVRARIGVQRWRALHRFTVLAWLLGLVHALGEGTDAGRTWFLAMTAIVAVPALALLTLRRLNTLSRRPARAAG